MPIQLLAASQEITVVPGGAFNRPVFCWVNTQNTGSGAAVLWYSADGLTEINRYQLTANATGYPGAGGPYPFMVAEEGEWRIKNRAAGASVFVFWWVALAPDAPG